MIESQQIKNFDVLFTVFIGEICQNLRDTNSLCVKWYATCEGQTSAPKCIVIPYTSPRLVDSSFTVESINDAEAQKALAEKLLSTMYIKCSSVVENVLELTLLERDTGDPECSVLWNSQHRRFYPQAKSRLV